MKKTKTTSSTRKAEPRSFTFSITSRATDNSSQTVPLGCSSCSGKGDRKVARATRT